jgi:bacteriocin-like protein
MKTLSSNNQTAFFVNISIDVLTTDELAAIKGGKNKDVYDDLI